MDREAQIQALMAQGMTRAQAEQQLSANYMIQSGVMPNVAFGNMEQFASLTPQNVQQPIDSRFTVNRSGYTEVSPNYGAEVVGATGSVFNSDGSLGMGDITNNTSQRRGVGRDSFNNYEEFLASRQQAGRTPEEAQMEWEEMGGNPTSQQKTTFGDMRKNGTPLIYGGGTSAEYEAYNFGRFAGMDKGTSGRGLGMVSSGLAFGLGTARNVLSGMAFSKQNQKAYEEYMRRQNQRTYSPNPQYQNQNNISGIAET